MIIPFVDRIPSKAEVERLRLILSTYQDGSGMLKREDFTLPGWRDFERSVAAAFKGKALESKWIYDVVLNRPDSTVQYGISCKMRGTLREVERKGRVTIELSNASGEFWDSVKTRGITQEDYGEHPSVVGATLIEVVEGWHINVGIEMAATLIILVAFSCRSNGRKKLVVTNCFSILLICLNQIL